MRRLAIIGVVVVAASVTALVSGARPAYACTVNGNLETCQYYPPASMPAGAVTTSRYSYWYTNKMWRPGYPAYNLVAVWFQNSSCDQCGYAYDPYANPVVTKGSFGYDRAWCNNLTTHSLNPTTCQVYNWDT